MDFNNFVHFMDNNNKLIHFVDFLIFHPSGMKSSTFIDFNKFVHFMDNFL